MTKLKILSLALMVAMALPAGAQVVDVRSVPLALAHELDGLSADDDYVMTAATIVDAKDDYTIAASPDTCRLVDITITDANSSITAGTVTVTGTDCWGAPLVATADIANVGTAVVPLVYSSGLASGPYFKTITKIENGAITGEGGAGDNLEVGFATDGTPAQYLMYGVEMFNTDAVVGVEPTRWVNIFDNYEVRFKVTTSGAASTTLAAVDATEEPYLHVAVGDLLILRQGGLGDFTPSRVVYRRVTARASATSVTLNASVNIPAAGQTFRYKRKFVLADDQDGWIRVEGWSAVSFLWNVDANTDTGGVVSDLTCAVLNDVYEPRYQVDSDTVASAAAGTHVTSINFSLVPVYQYCRFGMEFGTTDDDDTGAEDISLQVGFRR